MRIYDVHWVDIDTGESATPYLGLTTDPIKEIDVLRAELAEAKLKLELYESALTVFHDGVQWKTGPLKDMPRLYTEDEVIDYMDVHPELVVAVEEAKLRDALRRYGDHLNDCEIYAPQRKCSCGFDWICLHTSQESAGGQT